MTSGSGRLLSVTMPDPDGAGGEASPVTTFYHAGSDLIASRTDAKGQVASFGWSAFKLASVSLPGAASWLITPMQVGGLVTNPNTTNPRQSPGSIATTTNERGKVRQYKTDRFGRIVMFKNPLLAQTLIDRNADGQESKITRPDPGAGTPVIKLGYNQPGAGDLVKLINADGSAKTWIYNTTHHFVTTATDELSRSNNFTYNATGDLLTVTNPLGFVISYAFNSRGQVTSVTTPDPDGAGGPLAASTTQFAYNAALLPATQTNADGTSRVYTWHPEETLATLTDERGKIASFAWDDLDRLSSQTAADGGVTSYTYNPLGQVLTTVDALGLQVTNEFNNRNWLTKVNLPDPDDGGPLPAAYQNFSYDAAGNLTSESRTWMGGYLVSLINYTFDDAGRLIGQQGPVTTATWSFYYDTLDRLVTVIDPKGGSSGHEYNSRDWRTKETLNDPDYTPPPNAPITIWAYNAAGEVTSVTDPRGFQYLYGYDQRGLLTSETLPDPDGMGPLTTSVYTHSYDNAGREIGVTDPLSRVTNYAYDLRHRVTAVTSPDPDGAGPAARPVSTIAYDATSNVTGVTDGLGRTTNWAFDNVGRATSVTLPDPDGGGPLSRPVYATQYNLVGVPTQTTDPLNAVTLYAYDRWHRPTVTTLPDPDGGGPQSSPVETTVYNPQGLVAKFVDPMLREVQFSYDTAGRRTSVTDWAGKVTSYEFDKLNNVTKITAPDPDGAGPKVAPVTQFGFDGLSRRTSILDPNGGSTQFSYDMASNVLTVKDPLNNITTFAWDGRNRNTSETNQLGQSVQYVFDQVNNVTKVTDRNGKVREFLYDGLDRRTTELWKNGAATVRTISSTYDAADQLVSISDTDSAYAYGYDQLGRVLTVDNNGTPGIPRVILTSSYDAASNRTSLAASVGGTNDFLNTYSFDTLGRMSRVDQTANGGAAVAEKRVDFGYNASSEFTSITRYKDTDGGTANEVAKGTYTIDSVGRLTGLAYTKNGANIFTPYSWGYDDLSRVTTMTSADGTVTYSYDSNSQLIGADYSFQSDGVYSYDANGNRTMSGYTTGTNNRLTSDGTYNYLYDNEGNRTRRTKISNGEYEEYEWDHRNRLTKITFKTSAGVVTKVVQFKYDVFDRRIEKGTDTTSPFDLADAVFERYAHDGIDLIFDFKDADGAGAQPTTLEKRYLHGPGVDMLLAQENTATQVVVWPLADELGTTRHLVNSDGTIAGHFTFDAYGKQTSGPTNLTRFLYTGRELDPETGLYYYRARYYDASVGRFIAEDPIGFSAGDANLSRYVGNSPTMFVDPSGLYANGPATAQSPSSSQFDLIIARAVDAADAPSTPSTSGSRDIRGAIMAEFPDLTEPLRAFEDYTDCRNGKHFGCGPREGLPEWTAEDQLIVDLTQIVFDIAGIFDPTPISDGISGIMSLIQLDWWGAGTSVLGFIPGVGDLAKLGRIPKYIATIESAIRLAKNSPEWFKLVRQPLEAILGTLEQIPYDKLPQGVADQLKKVKDDLGDLLRPGKKRGPKTDPNAPHNAKIREEAAKLKDAGNDILAGGGGKEQLLPTPGGKKSGRRPDILYETPDGQQLGRNIGKTNADGTPVTREVDAMDDLSKRAMLPTDFVPYDR